MNSEQVCVVCRDAVAAEAIRVELAEQGLHRVSTIVDVEGLDEYLRDAAPSTIVLATVDGLTGEDVCRALAGSQRGTRPVPVLVLSPRYDEAEALLCFRLGAADYLGWEEHRRRLPGVLRQLAGLDATPTSPSRLAYPARRFAAMVD